MKNNSKYLWFGTIIVLVIVGCLFFNYYPRREGIDPSRMVELLRVLNGNDTNEKKMNQIESLNIGDNRFGNIISSNDLKYSQKVDELKSLTKSMMSAPISS